MNVSIRPEADQELYEAAAWYERRENGLGLRFLQSYEKALRRTQHDPDTLPRDEAEIEGRDIRRIQLKDFPFSIVVELFESYATILAVAHSHRRPGYWRKRI